MRKIQQFFVISALATFALAMNSTTNEADSAASVAIEHWKTIQEKRQLVKEARSETYFLRYQAVADIYKELAEWNANKLVVLVNDLVAANVVPALGDCLSKDGKYDDDQMYTEQPPKTLVSNAVEALTIIGKHRFDEVFKLLLKSTTPITTTSTENFGTRSGSVNNNNKKNNNDQQQQRQQDEDEEQQQRQQLLKHLIAILNDLTVNGKIEEKKGALNYIIRHTGSTNQVVADQAWWAAYHLIAQVAENQNIKVKYIETIIDFSSAVTRFCKVINEREEDTKMHAIILLALENWVSISIQKHKPLNEQLEQCRDEIELFITNSDTPEKVDKLFTMLVSRIEILNAIILPTSEGPRFRNIAESTAKTLLEQHTVVLPSLRTDISDDLLTPSSAFLLSSAPGTEEQTTLAKAIANECGAKLFSISATEIIDKKEEEAVEFIKMLFLMAKHATEPSADDTKNAKLSAIIFIDGIDALLGDGAKRRTKAQFLVQMDAKESHDGVLVLGVTNELTKIDPNALTRFDKRISY